MPQQRPHQPGLSGREAMQTPHAPAEALLAGDNQQGSPKAITTCEQQTRQGLKW